MRKIYIFGIFILITFSSCVSVESYQKMYLKDEDMQLGAKKIESLGGSAMMYREGASGANGGKNGGGCGCN